MKKRVQSSGSFMGLEDFFCPFAVDGRRCGAFYFRRRRNACACALSTSTVQGNPMGMLR